MTRPAPALDLRQPAEPPQTQPKPRGWQPSRRGLVLAASALVVGIGAAATWWLNHPDIMLPREIAAKMLFPIYLPTSLPAGYHFDPDTYSTQQSVLIFAAADEAGHQLTFSEQAKPQTYDIASFQQKSLTDAHSLPGAPYPAVIGKNEGGHLLLSVLTDTTWVIVSTKAPDGQAALEHIARQLKKQ